MPDIQPHNTSEYRLRSKLPQFVRIAAIGALAATVITVAIGFYRQSSKPGFRLKSEHARLSTDVVAEVSGYERLETEGGVSKYYIKADYAKTFSDDHQELTNVYLEVFDKEGVNSDKMTSEAAIYIPGENKTFTAYLKGNVKINTRDGLKVNTEHIAYTKATELVEADEAVAFERDAIRGKSFGANVKIAEKRLDLLKDVEIEMFESPELAKSNVRYGKVNAGTATYDQLANRIDLNQNVAFNILSKVKGSGNSQTTNTTAGRSVIMLRGGETNSTQLTRFEVFENVRVTSTEHGKPPTNIQAGYAMFEKDADRFTLRDSVHIVTSAQDKHTEIRANDAIFEQTAGKLALTGAAEVTQGGDHLKGDVINADLFPGNQIKHAVMRGNAFAQQSSPERTTTITAPELNAAFNELRQLQNANAAGQSTAELVPVASNEYSRVTVTAARGIGLSYKGGGLLDSMQTNGRTTIQLNSPNNAPAAANKRVTADAVTTYFQANGRDIRKAEAVGDAELYIEPLTAAANHYRTTINAPRFDCEFFPTGNNARSCVGGPKAKAVRVPTINVEGRGTQVLTADRLTAQFAQVSNDVERFDAAGTSKFNELDRFAIANDMSFTQADQMMRLRGGEPTVWDSRARAKAREIDWDTVNNRSSLRGAVSTTYYSRDQMRGSAPFGSSERPVFVTAETADIDHAAETATYINNARGWQDDNYVRGDRIVVNQRAGTFQAHGNVQSVLYNAKIKQGAARGSVPTSAAAGSMSYQRDSRVLQYRANVDIRQGTDRITADSADVYLNEKHEMTKTVAETNVIITQPTRRASGTWVQYTADDEVAILRGSPATVSDARQGSSQSGQMTFNMRDNLVVANGGTKPETSGRSRSVYKVRPSQ